jgi:acyl carrier protein
MSVTIRLNGSNYVSDKTRQAFEKALADGHHVEAPQPPVSAEPVRATPVAAPAAVAAPTSAEPLPVVMKEQEPTMPSLADYTRLLDSLDRGLAQSHDHQSQTLHVHEQYLGYQADYAKLFTQLLQQQGDIFAHGQVSPQQAELAAKVLDNLSSSMARFHDLQSETLSVHKHFLDQQTEFSQGQVDLLRQQSALAGAGVPLSAPKPASHTEMQPRENGHGERHEGHHGYVRHNGNGHGNGNGKGNGNGHLPVPVIEAAPVIRMPATIHPDTAVKPAPATAKPTARVAPATPEPVRAAPVVAAPVTPEPVRAAPVAAPVVTAPASAAPSADALTASLLAIVSEKTGYPADMLELSMDMEADLGIDSIKRVEIMGALQERHPGLPKVEPQALAELRTLGQIVAYVGNASGAASNTTGVDSIATPEPVQAAPVVAAPVVTAPASAAPSADALTASLLAIVSEKTGYPADMLELSMDMEADLGIDSIKRVEIMGALQERHPGLPKVEPQALAELRTLGQIVSFISTEPAEKKA